MITVSGGRFAWILILFIIACMAYGAGAGVLVILASFTLQERDDA